FGDAKCFIGSQCITCSTSPSGWCHGSRFFIGTRWVFLWYGSHLSFSSSSNLAEDAGSPSSPCTSLCRSSSPPCIGALGRFTSLSCRDSRQPNQSTKPTAPLQNELSVLVTTPCRGLISFSLDLA